MSFTSQKVVCFRPWDSPSPLAAKRHWLNGHSRGARDRNHGSDNVGPLPASVSVAPPLQVSDAPIHSQMPPPTPQTPQRRHVALLLPPRPLPSCSHDAKHHQLGSLWPPPPLPPCSHNAKRRWLESDEDKDDMASNAEDPHRDDRDAVLNGRLHVSNWR